MKTLFILLLFSTSFIKSFSQDTTSILIQSIYDGDSIRVNQIILSNPEFLKYKDKNGIPLLHYCVRLYQKEIASFLILKGAPLNEKDQGGYTPLSILTILLDEALHLDTPLPGRLEISGLTIKSYDAVIGYEKLVNLFIDKGALVDKNDANKLLSFVSARGDIKCVKAIIAKGGELNYVNDLGATPLHYAAIYGHPDIVKFLLSLGANKSIKTKAEINTSRKSIPENSTPLDAAMILNNKSIVDILSQKK